MPMESIPLGRSSRGTPTLHPRCGHSPGTPYGSDIPRRRTVIRRDGCGARGRERLPLRLLKRVAGQRSCRRVMYVQRWCSSSKKIAICVLFSTGSNFRLTALSSVRSLRCRSCEVAASTSVVNVASATNCCVMNMTKTAWKVGHGIGSNRRAPHIEHGRNQQMPVPLL